MISAPKPDNEQQRLEALRSYRILDSENEAAFDALTRLASQICNTPISVVSLVDEDRQWFKSAQGLPGVSETPREVAFCAHAILNHELMEIPDALSDPRFHDNPLVGSAPNIRFYAGMPLVDAQGFELGTLCVIDTQPKTLTDFQRQALSDLAVAVVGLIQARLGEARFREIVDKAPWAMAVVDGRGRIRLPNEALQNLLAVKAETLLNQPITRFVTTADTGRATPWYADATPGTALVGMRADGERLPLEASFSVLGDDLRAISLVDVSIRDAIAINARKAKEELQRIIDQIPALIGYWDRNLHNRFGNWAFREWFGIAPETMIGRHVRDILGEDRYRVDSPLYARALAGERCTFEMNMSDQHGREHDLLIVFQPDIEDGVVKGFYSLANDVTVLKQANQARAAAEAHLRSVIDAASEFSMIATDLDGNVTMFSRGSELMLGYTAEEFIGKLTPLVLHVPEEVEARRAAMSCEAGHELGMLDVFTHRAMQGLTDAGEWTYRRKDGSTLPVSLVMSAVHNAEGTLVGTLGIARDITEQKNFNAALAAARDAAEAASRAKSHFVANMSHEIRTPINAVLGMTHLLEHAPLNADRRRYTDMIRSAGEQLLGILNDILDFSKIEAGKLEIEPRDFQMQEVLTTVANIMSVNAGTRALELCIDVDPAIPATLTGDRLRLQQVLTNLVTNAIKFTEHGEVVVMVRLLDMDQQHAHIEFEVRDTGIGIDPDAQRRLFSPFSQADSSTTRRFGGTGLGLAICRRLVELMNGTIGLDSTPGMGSRFWFRVPFAVPAAGSTTRAAPRMAPLRVLIADDHALARHSLQQIFSAWGWHCDTVETASAVVARTLERTQQSEAYDLIVFDSELSGKAGFVALMNTWPEGRRAPAVVLTRSGLQTDDLEKQAWVSAALAKPVTVSSLMRVVEDACQAGGTPRAAHGTFSKVPTALRLPDVRLLLVEDNPLNQIVGRGILEQAGAQVVIAGNGQLAVDVLRARPADFDLVLMDVQMPVMDGFQATRMIRQELQLTLPVIAMTAGVLASERDHCIAAGMNDFIPKPINVQQMLGVLREHLKIEGTPEPQLPLPSEHTIASTPGTEVLDMDGIMAGMESNEQYVSTMKQLLEQLCVNGAGMVDAVVEAWEEGESRTAMGLLHKMRGGVGTLGALRLSELTVRLEQAMGEGRNSEVTPGLNELQQVMQATLDAARAWLDTH